MDIESIEESVIPKTCWISDEKVVVIHKQIVNNVKNRINNLFNENGPFILNPLTGKGRGAADKNCAHTAGVGKWILCSTNPKESKKAWKNLMINKITAAIIKDSECIVGEAANGQSTCVFLRCDDAAHVLEICNNCK